MQTLPVQLTLEILNVFKKIYLKVIKLKGQYKFAFVDSSHFSKSQRLIKKKCLIFSENSDDNTKGRTVKLK